MNMKNNKEKTPGRISITGPSDNLYLTALLHRDESFMAVLLSDINNKISTSTTVLIKTHLNCIKWK